ncbi:MAG TPA: Ig-like domain-containing protein [Solirubrobacterales bacterium]|jgi:hypothetical protein|nr:Ig-like domain-containing protein [Solirubrobacterales bacterium]
MQTTTSLNCGSALRFPGAAVECIVRTKSSGTGATAPTGSVKLAAEGGSINPSCTLIPVIGPESVCLGRYATKEGGQQTITASYVGDQTHLPSSGRTTIAVSSTATGLSCRPEVPAVGEATRCTAEVKNTGAASGAVSGTVSFKSNREGQFDSSTCTLGEANTCAVTYTPKATGTHLVTATYGGDATHPASHAEITFAARFATQTTVSCGSAVHFPGGGGECLIAVKSSAPGATAPTGMVKLTIEGGEIKPSCTLIPLIGPQSACLANFASRQAGLHTITARYVGDETHQASEGTAGVAYSDTVTSLTCDPESFQAGESTFCTAEVRNIGAAPDTITGTVRFKSSLEGQPEPSNCTLGEGNSCSVKFSPKAAGVYPIAATYEGDATHPSSGAETSVAAREVTTTTIGCGSAVHLAGRLVECLIQVKSSGAGATAPTGTVGFTAEGGPFTPNCTLIQVIGPNSACLLRYVPSEGGVKSIVASYDGDQTHLPSSAAASVSVSNTITTLTCRPQSPAVGESSTCTAEVKNAGVASDSLSGTLSFKSNGEGQFDRGSCNVGESNVCTVNYEAKIGGEHLITATYGGDATHPASHAETALAVRGTSVDLTCPTESIAPGASGTCLARVVNEGLGSRGLTGTVSFTSDGEGTFSAGQCTLAPFAGEDGGFCSVRYTPSAAGVHVIGAAYSGDATHPPARDGKGQINAAARPSSTTVACSPSPFVGNPQCVIRVRDTSASGGTVPVGGVEWSSNEEESRGLFVCILEPVSAVESICSFTYEPELLQSQLLAARFPGVDGPHVAAGTRDKIHAPSQATIRLIYPTATEVDCGGSAVVGELKACTATVRARDIDPRPSEGRPTAPTGSVRFSSPAAGTFSQAECRLAATAADASSCTVSYRPQAAGNHPISALYGHDLANESSFDTEDLVARVP